MDFFQNTGFEECSNMALKKVTVTMNFHEGKVMSFRYHIE